MSDVNNRVKAAWGKWSGKTHVWLQDQIKLYDLQNTTEIRVLMRWARGNTM